jgi:hypothetical protein
VVAFALREEEEKTTLDEDENGEEEEEDRNHRKNWVFSGGKDGRIAIWELSDLGD